MGIESFKSNLAAFNAKLAFKVERACDAVARAILDKSQDLVPIETEALRQSAGIRQEAFGFNASFVVGYAKVGETYSGFNNEGHWETRRPWTYAFFVHQNLGSGAGSYGKYGPERGPLFLRKASTENLPDLRRVFTEELVRW